MALTSTINDLNRCLTAYRLNCQQVVVRARHYQANVAIWGEGPPLVLIHGMCDIPLSFCMIIERLSKHFRCFNIALPTGDGDGCRIRRYRHQDHTEDLTAIFDALKLDSAHLFGSSFGSTVSLRFAAERPDRVKNITLQGGFAYRKFHRVERGLARLARYWPGHMHNLKVRKYIMAKMDQPQFIKADQGVYDFFLYCSGETLTECGARRALMLCETDLRPVLHTIPHPTLFIGGDRDGLVPLESEMMTINGLPNAKRIEISECGHYPQYTHPDECAKMVIEFLK